MSEKNIELKKQVEKWMVSTIRNFPVGKTTLARLATTQFRLQYHPAWVDQLAEEIVTNGKH